MCFVFLTLELQVLVFLLLVVYLRIYAMDSTPGGSNSEDIYLSRRTLIGYYRESTSRNDSEKMQYLYRKVENAFKKTVILSDAKSLLQKLIHQYKTKLNKYQRHYERCLNDHKDWFNQYICYNVSQSRKRKLSGGRPPKDFEELTERSKRQRTENVRQQMTSSELAYATQMKYRASGETEKSKLVKEVSRDHIPRMDKNHETLCPDKALSMVIEAQLTKHQYNILRKTALELQCNLYPNYETITKAKKACYPSGIQSTEIHAEVPVQNLMDHTAQKLLLSLREVIQTLNEEQRKNLCLISKWGCDGSGSHSQYKQKFQNIETSDDEHLLITSIVPLRLIIVNDSDSHSEYYLVWQNPRPSSPRYCRSLRLQMAQETVEVSKLEPANVKDQKSQITPTTSDEWRVTHDLKLTMVDGKMINALTDTSSAMRCYVCLLLRLTSKYFNHIRKCINKQVTEENFEYGLSSLHAWIRFAECILHLGYKIKIGKWQARGEDKVIVANEKKESRIFWQKLGLHVDKPRQGGGTSTDGNTARKLFLHSEKTAKITGVNLNLIKRFNSILKIISSKINFVNVNLFCLRTAALFVFNYPWYNMTTTVHKILLHGPLIVENIGIAIGLLSEDAQESRNKDVRKLREKISRKFSRKLTMEDTFKRLMVSSDPFITGLRKLLPKKHVAFSSTEMSMINAEE